MAKNDVELQALREPQSRSEEFLNYMTGRATDINALPNPASALEEYLEYLAYNGTGGGTIGIDQVTGLRDELDKKGDNLFLSDDKLSLRSGVSELSNVPMITTAEIQLILNNLT